MCIDGDCVSLVEFILRPIINLNFCVARNWLLRKVSGTYRMRSLQNNWYINQITSLC